MMAEAQKDEPTFPRKGKVQAVRQQWSVHEDGALAYQMQNEEITEHYGLNRYHRRTVRGDIPVAKIVQSEEEYRQQEERMRELEAYRAQAEEDAKVAKIVSDRLQNEIAGDEISQNLNDEEIARQLQEKEKKRYERHLEKKREKKLKEERLRLEGELARDTEEARLRLGGSDGGSEHVANSIENLDIQGVNVTRVTAAGRIEDDGDFSDFYNLPSEMDEFTRMEIQASQDEELARLLQEQEHKRSKAEVDQDKLRRIELQDEQLARVIQEQERLRLRKAKHKHQQKKEALRQQTVEAMPLGASANSMNQNADLSGAPAATHITSSSSGNGASGHRYRRNSYTQAFDSPPPPPKSQPPPRPVVNKTVSDPSVQARSGAVQIPASHQQYSRTQMPPPSSSSKSSPRSSRLGAGGGMSTLESARRIAAGDHEGIMAAQLHQSSIPNPHRGGSLQEKGTMSSPRDGMANVDVVRSLSHPHSATRMAGGSSVDPRLLSPSQRRRHPQTDAHAYTQSYIKQPHEAEVTDPDATEVLKWLNTQDRAAGKSLRTAHHGIEQESGSFDSEDEMQPHHGAYPNGSSGFNIATAIDPTYQRRHPEAAFVEETQLKSHIPFSRSLPQADGELEWDPGLRGSLRKTKAMIHNYQDSTVSSSASHSNAAGGDPMSSFQPVQGQRRGETKSRKQAKKPSGSNGDNKKDKGNCKQQ